MEFGQTQTIRKDGSTLGLMSEDPRGLSGFNGRPHPVSYPVSYCCGFGQGSKLQFMARVLLSLALDSGL